ncbi:MAG: M4 family metallopeptidase, partial [Pseudomonadota bacterium]|nr:M4 family metallopeptidase [Pseudomonadota bacterium]
DYPIWNAHAVIHTPSRHNRRDLSNLVMSAQVNKSMNGKMFQHLEADLDQAPTSVFSKLQAELAEQFVVDAYKTSLTQQADITVKNIASELVVFVDEKNLAHWVYKIHFDVPSAALGELPAKPHYIVDAQNFKIYQNWNDIKTADVFVPAGGFGGNPVSGKMSYDGLKGHHPSFTLRRAAGQCYLENNDITVTHALTNKTMHFPCPAKNAMHNNIYWNEDFDLVNKGYSPANDAMFTADVVRHLYQEWCGVPVLFNEDGSPMRLQMVVHVPQMDNAYWDGEKMTFGDGNHLYPLTTLGIGAHEVSHGFTQQHSNLNYEGQSGAMNESFSDMASQAAEFYVYKKNNWAIGNDVLKFTGEAMRYMDIPSKDCYGKAPGTHCSIDNANQYYHGLDVHFSSGVYNRAYYMLSTQPGWNPRKAFQVMVHANASYWTPNTQFTDGAACVVKAAEDLHLDMDAVKQAFKAVGINADQPCTNQEKG